MGRGPEHERAAGPALADREAVLRDLGRHWPPRGRRSTARGRPSRRPTPELIERLGADLPEEPGDAQAALGDAVHVLDASVSPSRPLFLAYIGSSGLEVGVLASALRPPTTRTWPPPPAPPTSRPAGRAVGGAVRRVPGRRRARSPAAARRPTSPRCSRRASARSRACASRRRGTPGAVYCSDEAHHSVVRAVEAAGLGAARCAGCRSTRGGGCASTPRRGARPRRGRRAHAGRRRRHGRHDADGRRRPDRRDRRRLRAQDVWLHVDGAYGVPAAATGIGGATVRGARPRGLRHRRRAQVARRAEELQPHPAAAPGSLRDAFGHEERYMLHEADAATPSTSPRVLAAVRSLRLWLALRVHGAAQFRAWIERTLHIARAAGRAARGAPRVRAAARADALDGLLPPVPAGCRRTGSTATTSGSRTPCSATADLPRAGVVDGQHVPARVLRQLPHHARCGGARARGRRRARRGCAQPRRPLRARSVRAGPAEPVAGALRQRADDEVVGVLDEVADELVGQAAVERDRVPVALVEVIAGTDRGVAAPQRDGELRLALDADLERLARSSGVRANIFPATLNTECSGPNGKSSIAPVCSRQYARSSWASTGAIVAPADTRGARRLGSGHVPARAAAPAHRPRRDDADRRGRRVGGRDRCRRPVGAHLPLGQPALPLHEGRPGDVRRLG